MILLANSRAGLRGPQAPENSSFGVALCQLRWHKATPKRSCFGGLRPPNLPILIHARGLVYPKIHCGIHCLAIPAQLVCVLGLGTRASPVHEPVPPPRCGSARPACRADDGYAV